MIQTLKEIKGMINKVIDSTDKSEISEIINSLNNLNVSSFFRQNIIKINLDLENYFDLKDYKFHSLLTLQQAMIDISGMGLQEIQSKLNE